VPDFADCPAIASAEILDDLEVFRFQVQVELDANLELILVTLPVRSPGTGIFGCRGRFRGRRLQSETLDVLALHGARGKSVSHDGRLGQAGGRAES
jgi:hypothetical protein